MRVRADVGRTGTGIEPNVPVPPERAGHGGGLRAVSRRSGAASHSETGWADAAGTHRLQPMCCAIASRSDPSRSRGRPRAPSRTYFPHEDCVFLRMTEGRTQSSAGDRSSQSRSTFPILHCAPPRELSWVDTRRAREGRRSCLHSRRRVLWSAPWCFSVSGAASGGADDASAPSTPRPAGSAHAEAARDLTPTRSNAVRSPERIRRPLPGLVQHR